MSNNGLIMKFVYYFKERKNYWLLPTILLLSLVLLSSGVFAWNSQLDRGLISWYSLNETTGTNVLDSVNGFNASYENSPILAVNGIIGTAMQTDGDNTIGISKLDIGNGIIGNNSYSVSLWFNSTNIDDDEYVFTFFQTSTTNTRALRVSNADGGKKLGFRGGGICDSYGIYVLDENIWYHAVIVYSGSEIDVYLNGNSIPVFNCVDDTDYGSIIDMKIGSWFGTGTTGFKGVIDEVGIWNRTLNFSEITQLYNNGDGLQYSPSPSPMFTQPYCKNLTIVGGSNLINNFISYINVSYNLHMQSNFEDIRIYNQPCGNGGNELPYEFDNVINSNSAGIWLKSNLNTGNNVYSIYYGNSTIGNGEQPNIVWSDYNLVYHFSEGSGTLTKDSSPTNNTGILSNSGLWNNIGTGFGKGLTWSNDYVVNSSGVSGISGDMQRTAMFWYAGNDVDCMVDYGLGYCGRTLGLLGNYDGYPSLDNQLFSIGDWDGLNSGYFMLGDLVGGYKPNTLRVNDYSSFFSVQYNGSITEMYQNKSYDGVGYVHNYNTTSTNLLIGSEVLGAYGYFWRGDVDEFRLSNITFSQDYLDRNVDNQNMSMFSIGVEESLFPPIIDDIYPVFSNIADDSGTLTTSGIGNFNVTVINTNGTVLLVLNGTEYATENVSDFYYATFNFTHAGSYPYYWYAYGNGTNNNDNASLDYFYVVNDVIPTPTPTPTNNYNVIGASGYGISAFFGGLTSSLSGLIVILAIVGAIVLILGGVVFMVLYAINYVRMR